MYASIIALSLTLLAAWMPVMIQAAPAPRFVPTNSADYRNPFISDMREPGRSYYKRKHQSLIPGYFNFEPINEEHDLLTDKEHHLLGNSNEYEALA